MSKPVRCPVIWQHPKLERGLPLRPPQARMRSISWSRARAFGGGAGRTPMHTGGQRSKSLAVVQCIVASPYPKLINVRCRRRLGVYAVGRPTRWADTTMDRDPIDKIGALIGLNPSHLGSYWIEGRANRACATTLRGVGDALCAHDAQEICQPPGRVLALVHAVFCCELATPAVKDLSIDPVFICRPHHTPRNLTNDQIH